MKTTVPYQKTSFRLFLSSLFILLVLFPAREPLYASGNLPVKNKVYPIVLVNKDQNNKSHNLCVFNNGGRTPLLFTVNGVEGKNYQLFVFDMDSRLVAQASMRNRRITALNNISKGDYLFEVFHHDQQVQNGRLTVK
jgi:hypothetical protein